MNVRDENIKQEKKSSKINKIEKKDIFIFIGMLFFSYTICYTLFFPHCSPDTYLFKNLGYFSYGVNFFLKDGRLFSAMFSILGGILRIPFDVFVVLSSTLAILFLTLASFKLYKMLKERIEIKEKGKDLLLVMIAILTIWNGRTIELLIFAESAIMCLGVFLTIYAIQIYLKEKRNPLLKSFLILAIASLCYQGSINLFLPVTLALLMLKEGKEHKQKIKYFIKETLKLGIIWGLALCVAALFMYEIRIRVMRAKDNVSKTNR
ncbi:MAG: glucosyltransferase domain-containing protein [Clostridia bacterium]